MADNIKVEFIEKELINVKFAVVDRIEGGTGGTTVVSLDDLTDVQIASLLEGQLLQYDSVDGVWKNVSVATIVDNRSVFNEVPSKISATVFQTAFDFVSGTVRVFLNGIKLDSSTITETNTNEITLDDSTKVGDIVEINYVKI